MAVDFTTPTPCPDKWEYKDHPRYTVASINKRTVLLLKQLRSMDASSLEACFFDTRPAHALLFEGLTPTGHPYFAGNYRGTPLHHCLAVDVGIGRRRGTPHFLVASAMNAYQDKHAQIVAQLHQQSITGVISDIKTLAYNVALLTAALLEHFYRIHPYVNGNGHAGRYLIWAVMGRFNIWARSSEMSSRPPTMDQALELYRNGDQKPLVKLILEWINPPIVSPISDPTPASGR